MVVVPCLSSNQTWLSDNDSIRAIMQVVPEAQWDNKAAVRLSKTLAYPSKLAQWASRACS